MYDIGSDTRGHVGCVEVEWYVGRFENVLDSLQLFSADQVMSASSVNQPKFNRLILASWCTRYVSDWFDGH